jgi:hypothetical protein
VWGILGELRVDCRRSEHRLADFSGVSATANGCASERFEPNTQLQGARTFAWLPRFALHVAEEQRQEPVEIEPIGLGLAPAMIHLRAGGPLQLSTFTTGC